MSKKKEHGFSLIQMIVAVGIFGILASLFASMQTQQANQIRGLMQKSEIVDIQNMLSRVLSNEQTCLCMLSHGSFDSQVTNGSQYLDVNTIRSSCSPSAENLIAENQPLMSGIVPESIRLTELKPTGNPNEWMGYWSITWKQSSLATPAKASKIRQIFLIDPSTPAGNTKIESCVSPGHMSCREVSETCATDPNGCDIVATCPMGYHLTSCWNEEDGGSMMRITRESGPNGEDQCHCIGSAPSEGLCWVAKATCCQILQ